MAFARAREHRHEFMTVEHLLLALLSNPSAREALEACSVDLVALRQELEAFIEQTTPVLPATEEERDTQPTLSFQRVLQRAVFHVQSSGRSEVTGANVLVAIFSEQESQAAYLLRKHEVSRLDVVNFISHGTRKDEPSQSSDNSGSQPGNEEQAGGEERMENFTTNLNQLARVGGIDPLIGREKELERAIQVLCRRRKNNPLLVGESGVGKTAIAEGLAWRIVQGDVGKIRVIGSTTYQEFSNIFEKDRALARRFQKIDITEPSVEETVQIINGLKPKYEAHHDVRYTAKAVRAAVELAVKYINDRHLPDKAIDVIDEAGARARLMPVSKRKKTVNVADIESVVARIARIPEKSVSRSDRVLRFDMSEYMERHTVSRLIGAPPGYVGFDQGGLLTDAVIKHPHAVLLLDEIEKAHPDVFNLLLQVMDNGTLTDNNGRKADFRNVVLVMTTNAGVRETERKSIGLIQQDNSPDAMDEIKKIFTPEFRNRLDNIIWFDHLSTTVIHQVLLFGSLVDGGQVTVSLDSDKNTLTYDFQSAPKHKPEAAH